MAKKHSHKKTYYNDIALRLAHKLFGVEHLHYGYFEKGTKQDLANLPKAQEAYVKQVLSFIPKGVKRIFDVGCGTGGVAQKLVQKKYDVVCLAPDPYLIEKTKENTDGKVDTITDLYENVEHLASESFDLALMSESCQYVAIEPGWKQHNRFIRPGGYVLIADFFKIKEIRPGISKSGHPLEEFKSAAAAAGFKLLKEKDITKFVAPTMDIYQSIIKDKIFPVFEAIGEFLSRRHPFILKIIKMFLGKKITKLHEKYSNQGSDIFQEYKSYRIMLFQKNS